MVTNVAPLGTGPGQSLPDVLEQKGVGWDRKFRENTQTVPLVRTLFDLVL